MKYMILIGCLLSSFVTAAAKPANAAAVDEFVKNAFHLSEVMLHDATNPPAASRFYAYAMLGAYGVLSANNERLPVLGSAFTVAPGFTFPALAGDEAKVFAAIYAMLETGRLLMPSGYMLEKDQRALEGQFRKKYRLSAKAIDYGKTYAVEIARQVVNYAKTDGYLQLSTLTRYKPNTKEAGRWYPTPPEYMPAIEPEWKTIRTFFIDSASQFIPAPPVQYNEAKGSGFYSLMHEVYEVTCHLTDEQKAIASFWDCNPFAVTYSGHMSIGLKKISPGGHWMSITGIACKKADASFEKTVLAHTLVALTLHDAFISCWDEKYRSDRIRPETVINRFLDPEWHPLLQTPPFPEYTSGHSVISTASAEMLTLLFGDGFEFTDTSEEYFGLPPRSFGSFREACNEAAISRLYGGIHYRDAIEEGQTQGRAVAKHIIGRLSAYGELGSL